PEKNKWLIIGIVLLTPVLFHFAKNVEFDSDLMHLNYLSPDLKKAQEEVSKNNAMALSAVYVMAKGTNEEQALQHLEQATKTIEELTRNHKVRSSSNPVALLPSTETQQKKAAAWQQYWTEEKKEQVLSSVRKHAVETGFNPQAFSGLEAFLSQPVSVF